VNLKRYRDFVIVLLALVVPFWFLRASMRDTRRGSGANLVGPDRVIVLIAEPVQWITALLARGISNLLSDYVYLVDVKQDNSRLSAQNARLQEQVRKLEALQDENQRLRRLLDLRQNLRSDVVSAQVIGKNTNDFFRVARVTLDRAAHNIGPNLPVLAQDGVVGITVKSVGDAVDVRLVVDANCGVDIVVQRTGARGYVRGTGDERSYSVNVQYVQRADEVEVGDLLVTSGVGRRFPKGIPVGVVNQVVHRDFGIYQQVVATPTVDFSRLEEVLIVMTVPMDDHEAAQGDSPRK
jgi:rod shape-determining protein MreC